MPGRIIPLQWMLKLWTGNETSDFTFVSRSGIVHDLSLALSVQGGRRLNVWLEDRGGSFRDGRGLSRRHWGFAAAADFEVRLVNKRGRVVGGTREFVETREGGLCRWSAEEMELGWAARRWNWRTLEVQVRVDLVEEQ